MPVPRPVITSTGQASRAAKTAGGRGGVGTAHFAGADQGHALLGGGLGQFNTDFNGPDRLGQLMAGPRAIFSVPDFIFFN